MTLVIDKKRVGDWVKERVKNVQEWGPDYQGMGWERNGQLVSGVVYNHYSGNDICLSVAGSRFWAMPEVLKMYFRYPFIQLECQRVTALVASKNTKSRTLVEKLGFTPEGRLREGAPDDDLLVFGMLRRECRWLGETDEQRRRVYLNP